MNNEQKEITIKDVREMTDKQRAKITPEQKEKLLEELRRIEKIRSAKFINNENFIKFLRNNGINILGYDHKYYSFNDRHTIFTDFDRFCRDYRWTNKSLVLLGNKKEDNSIIDFSVEDIVENKFVKYFSWGVTEFKIYTIVNNPDADGFGSDEPSYMAKLEKDLSNEWIKFWALKDEDYAKYVLSECASVKNNKSDKIEYQENLLARRIAELQAETKKRIDEINKNADRYNEIEQIIKNVKDDSLKI